MIKNKIKQNIAETLKLLWQFKWYILVYLLFYFYLLICYLIPSPKNYFIWNNETWYSYDRQIYLGVTNLLLIIFFLIFLIGISNMRNHPKIAKLIFLSALWFGAVFLQLI